MREVKFHKFSAILMKLYFFVIECIKQFIMSLKIH